MELRNEFCELVDRVWELIGKLGDADDSKVVYLDVSEHLITAAREIQNAIIAFRDIEILALKADIN